MKLKLKKEGRKCWERERERGDAKVKEKDEEFTKKIHHQLCNTWKQKATTKITKDERIIQYKQKENKQK